MGLRSKRSEEQAACWERAVSEAKGKYYDGSCSSGPYAQETPAGNALLDLCVGNLFLLRLLLLSPNPESSQRLASCHFRHMLAKKWEVAHLYGGG